MTIIFTAALAVITLPAYAQSRTPPPLISIMAGER